MGLRLHTTPYGFWIRITPGNGSTCSPREFPHKPQLGETLVPWNRIHRIALTDPWPTLELDYTDVNGDFHQRVFHVSRIHRVMRFQPNQAQFLQFERSVLDFLMLVGRRNESAEVQPGWRDAPVVEWEKLEQLPDFLAHGDGAYRSAASPVIAHRKAPGVLGAAMAWLRSSPDMDWDMTAKECVLTAETLYVLQWDDEYWAIPRDTLRTRVDHRGGHKTYVFGRRGSLVLRKRRDCPVQRELDRQLGLRGA